MTDWGVPAMVAGMSLLEIALVAPDGAAAAVVLSLLSCLALVPRRRWPRLSTLVAGMLTLLNQAGQHWNHCLFWQVMSPKGGGEKLPQRLGDKITQDLGGFAQFKEAFKQAGVTQFGSGWAWLIIAADGKLKVTKTPNGANPLSTGEGQPILGVDVWEHSYYLDFRNLRPNYLDNFLAKLVDWEKVDGFLSSGGMKSGQSA